MASPNSPENLIFPAAYYKGVASFFEPTDKYSPTYFGGPSEFKWKQSRHDASKLHHILHISQNSIPALDENHIGSLPLFYGCTYAGCSVTYRLTGFRTIRLLAIKPKRSSRDFPYAGFPTLLPYVPLRVAKQKRCLAKEFAKLTWQGIEIESETMVVVLPPIFVGGVSMWGPMGDAEGVQLIFKCHFGSQTIEATNQCG